MAFMLLAAFASEKDFPTFPELDVYYSLCAKIIDHFQNYGILIYMNLELTWFSSIIGNNLANGMRARSIQKPWNSKYHIWKPFNCFRTETVISF